jgi:hypothetical protein
MPRRAVVALLLAISMLAVPYPASAAGPWDPDDVRGPFDLRWVGAGYMSSTSLAFFVSFYEGFEVSELPWRPRGSPGPGRLVAAVLVTVDVAAPNMWASFQGYLLRRAGDRIAFAYGDLGSSCGADFPHSCDRGTVKQLGPNLIRVTIDDLLGEQSEGFTLSVETFWTTPVKTNMHDEIADLVVPG